MAARVLVLRPLGSLLCLLLALSLTAAASQDPVRHDVTVRGQDYTFTPSRIDAATGDIIRITLIAEDVPCSFAIDAYRISKRATPGHPVTFEFRADRAGTFPFYCDLTTDENCRTMRGEFVVGNRL
ncbi:MAG: cupredoxin domain-containing protein [Vicinamibacterales bacterium]|nr:cupredoxin domain-containing protein [Vicinamibacterales bacterium]